MHQLLTKTIKTRKQPKTIKIPKHTKAQKHLENIKTQKDKLTRSTLYELKVGKALRDSPL